jgi:transcriptional regulator with XRE-family HTH domain
MSLVETGSALRGARRSLGISVATASKLAGISPSTVKRWEVGKGLPRASEVQSYLDLIGVPADSVFRSQAELNPKEEVTDRPLMRMLRAKRRRNLVTLEDLSSATGLSVATLHRYETGERVPDAETLRVLARAYGCEQEEINLLCDCPTANVGGSLIEKFVEPGQNPHFWLYRRLEEGSRHGASLTPEEAIDLVHGLMVMGDHRGMLEAWGVLKPGLRQLAFSPEARAEINLSLILARLTVSRDAKAARDRIGRWRDYAEELPSGAASARAMSHLGRLAAALGDLDEAEQWVGRLEHYASHAGDAGMLFVCSVNRQMLAFDRAPSWSSVSILERVREQAVGALQRYTGDVAALYMFDRLGDAASVQAMLDRCRADEATYGFGSPLAARIRRRSRSSA